MEPTDFAECWAAYMAEAEISARCTDPRVQRRRDFMAGAMAYHALRDGGRPAEALLAELIGFGRALGTAAERASA